MLSDSEVTIEQAAEILDLNEHEVMLLINRRMLPSRMHIAVDGKRTKLLPRQAVLDLRGAPLSRHLGRDDLPPEPEREQATPEPAAAIPPAPPLVPVSIPETANTPTPEPAAPPPRDSQTELAMLQTLTSAQERIAGVERRLESLAEWLTIHLTAKVITLATKDDLKTELAEQSRNIAEELRRATDAQKELSRELHDTQGAMFELNDSVKALSARLDAQTAHSNELHAETTTRLAAIAEQGEEHSELIEQLGRQLAELLQLTAEESEKWTLSGLKKRLGDVRKKESDKEA